MVTLKGDEQSIGGYMYVTSLIKGGLLQLLVRYE